MKHLIIILIMLLSCISCKKNYTCDCSTIDTRLGFINQTTYHVKEKNKNAAMTNCAKQYEASGKATGGVNCEIK